MIEDQLIENELSEEMLEEVYGGKELCCTKRKLDRCPYTKKEAYIRTSPAPGDVRFSATKTLRQVYTNRCEECGRFYYGPDKKGWYYDPQGSVL